MSDELRPANPWGMDVFAEGGLWSCVDDLARWVGVQFLEGGGARSGGQILAGPTLEEMHRPRYLGDEEWTEAWCISWYAKRKDGVTWIQHSGGLPGFITSVCFHRGEAPVGAIALLNGIADADELAMTLASIALRAAAEAVEPAEVPPPTPEGYRGPDRSVRPR